VAGGGLRRGARLANAPRRRNRGNGAPSSRR